MLASLPRQGWEVTKWHNMWGVGVFAKKDGVTALVYCSGTDFPLHADKCNQVRHAGLNLKRYVAFVHGDVALPKWRELVRHRHEALLPVQDVAQFDTTMQALMPTMTGAVETIDPSGLVTGFVKLAPHGRARVVATRDDIVVGECTADLMRPELKRFGDGRYGFKLRLAEKMSAAEVIETLSFHAYSGLKHVGVVKYDVG